MVNKYENNKVLKSMLCQHDIINNEKLLYKIKSFLKLTCRFTVVKASTSAACNINSLWYLS